MMFTNIVFGFHQKIALFSLFTVFVSYVNLLTDKEDKLESNSLFVMNKVGRWRRFRFFYFAKRQKVALTVFYLVKISFFPFLS